MEKKLYDKNCAIDSIPFDKIISINHFFIIWRLGDIRICY